MKAILIISMFLLTNLVKSQNAYLGLNNSFTASSVCTGVIAKTTISHFQFAMFANYDFVNKWKTNGIQLGAVFYKSSTQTIGTNIMYDGTLYLPSLNVMHHFKTFTLDLNLRPAKALIQIEANVVVNLN